MLAIDLKLGTAHAFDHSRKGDHPRACGFNVPPCHGRRQRRLRLVEVSPLFPLFPDQNRRTHSDQRHQFSNFPICDGNAAVGPVLASMPDFLSRYTVGKAMNHDLASGIVPGLHRPTAIPSVRVADLQRPMVCALGHKSVYPVEAFWSLPVALARFVTFRIEAECNPVRSNSVTPRKRRRVRCRFSTTTRSTEPAADALVPRTQGMARSVERNVLLIMVLPRPTRRVPPVDAGVA